MRERTVLLGPDQSLVGIVSEPTGETRETRPAFVFLNAGIVHRVGPNRLYVRLARALAQSGFPSLRFDFSGVGDSEAGNDGLSYEESAPLETQRALEYLTCTKQIDRFVLVGICSGAHAAFRVACLNPRVVGAVMINTHAYPTPRFYLQYWTRRLLNIAGWRNTLTGRNEIGRRLVRLAHGRAPVRAMDAELAETPNGNMLPARAQAAKTLRGLLDRGVKLCFVYSGNPTSYNYPQQFRDAFPDMPYGERLRVEYFPNADHTFTRMLNQQVLIDTVRRWASTSLGALLAALYLVGLA